MLKFRKKLREDDSIVEVGDVKLDAADMAYASDHGEVPEKDSKEINVKAD